MKVVLNFAHNALIAAESKGRMRMDDFKDVHGYDSLPKGGWAKAKDILREYGRFVNDYSGFDYYIINDKGIEINKKGGLLAIRETANNKKTERVYYIVAIVTSIIMALAAIFQAHI